MNLRELIKIYDENNIPYTYDFETYVSGLDTFLRLSTEKVHVDPEDRVVTLECYRF